jgi:hypothetical protein
LPSWTIFLFFSAGAVVEKHRKRCKGIKKV